MEYPVTHLTHGSPHRHKRVLTHGKRRKASSVTRHGRHRTSPALHVTRKTRSRCLGSRWLVAICLASLEFRQTQAYSALWGPWTSFGTPCAVLLHPWNAELSPR